MLLRNLFKKYKDDSQFVSLFSCWLEHQQGPCRNEGPERQDSTKLVHPKVQMSHFCVPSKKTHQGSEARCKGVNVPQQCFPSASQLHSDGPWPGVYGTVPSLGLENQNLFLYHLCVSVCVCMCVESPVFQYVWVILLWKNTCEPCFICCRDHFQQWDQKRTFPGPDPKSGTATA